MGLGGTHPYHVLGPHTRPLRHSWGPQKGPFWPRKALLGALGSPGGLVSAQVPLVGPTGFAASISCAGAPYETNTALLGPWPALGDLIWAQLPLVGPTGWATWLGCYMYSLGHIGPPFQPQRPLMGYLAPIPSVLSPHFGSNFISGRI